MTVCWKSSKTWVLTVSAAGCKQTSKADLIRMDIVKKVGGASFRDADFPLFSVFSVIFGLIHSPPIRFPFSVFSIFSYFIFLFLNFLSLFVFIFCEMASTRRFSVIFAKVQWHPCSLLKCCFSCKGVTTH